MKLKVYLVTLTLFFLFPFFLEGKKMKTRSDYSCHICMSEDCSQLTECHGAYKCFSAIVRDDRGVVKKSKGCAKNPQQTSLYCGTKSYDGKVSHAIHQKSAQYAFSCCRGDFCNNGTWPILPPVPKLKNDTIEPDSNAVSASSGRGHLLKLALAISLPVIFFIIFVTIILFWMKRRHIKRMKEMNKFNNMNYGNEELVGLRATAAGDSTLREVFNDHSMSSGSGSGQPFLVQRTMAKQIVLGECIGKGRYGEVWKGLWNGDSVAVKIFFSRDEDSWKRETDIYSTMLLRHENILGYIGSDCTSLNSCTQLWLVTHYHPIGSLYDHLNRETLGLEETMKILLSTLNGLVHLHTEIFGTQGKPAIAHRDMKSKNILVRLDGNCVIADFGLAVTHTQNNNELTVPKNVRVGTKRYMSPELLDESINLSIFESYRRVDIYAFSLVMWEVLRRTRSSSNNMADDYALPYHQNVGPDPGFDEMKKVVCIDMARPEITIRWVQDSIMNSLTKLMQECWHGNANVRLPALRIKKSIKNIIRSDPKLHMFFDDDI